MSDRCPICLSGSTTLELQNPFDFEYFKSRAGDVELRRCEECSAIFQAPLPHESEAASFYDENYQNYTKSSVPLLAALYSGQQQAAARSFVQEYGVGSSLLDYGCGNGEFLRLLSRQGMKDLAGYEVSMRVDTQGETTEGVSYYTSFSALVSSGRKFDIVRMNHVIEHLCNLDATMTQIASLLKPNGRVIGQTPNAAHYTSYIWGKYWGALHYPYHTMLFGPESFRRSVSRWGDVTLGGLKATLQPTAWSMSFENYYKTLRKLKMPGRTRLYSIFVMASAPFVIFDYLRGRRNANTGVIDFVIAKRNG